MLLTQGKAFRFVLEDKGNVSVINAQKLNVASQDSELALFPIRPVALGEMEVTVEAVSAQASDSLVWKLLVKVRCCQIMSLDSACLASLSEVVHVFVQWVDLG